MNALLKTDVYKMGHMEQTEKGLNKVYSYLTTRSDHRFDSVIFFGLQYFLMKYLSRGVTYMDVEEFLDVRKSILGLNLSNDLVKKLFALADMRYFPLLIKAVPEGAELGKYNALMTMTNTHPDYGFLVGFFESLLLKVWNTCTVATASSRYKRTAVNAAHISCDNMNHIPFCVHDFGYRGCSSEETAELSGMAHLINFLGTDTVPAVVAAKRYYQAAAPVGLSVPATEHFVMCSYGRRNEFKAFEAQIDRYPKDTIISIVSDTYNLWNVLTKFAPRLKKKILARSGKVVFRPDSGNPVDIICGTKRSAHTAEETGVLRLLEHTFGSEKNTRGYKTLNPRVGTIYGDGMYPQRYQDMLDRVMKIGFASSEITIGVGGILTQSNSRDDLGFAFKAVHCEVDGQPRTIYKDPITDKKKKSHKGLLRLEFKHNRWKTYDRQTPEQEKQGQLRRVFENGVLYNSTTLDDVRQLVKNGYGSQYREG